MSLNTRKIFTQIKIEAGECTIYEPKAYDILFALSDMLGHKYKVLGHLPFLLARMVEIKNTKLTVDDILDLSGTDYIDIMNVCNVYFEKFNLNNILKN